MRIIVVAGKSGAGKQPRIEALVSEFKLVQLSTGNIFREYLGLLKKSNFSIKLTSFWDEKKKDFLPDSEMKKILEDNGFKEKLNDFILGIKAKFYIEAGKFVPDKITNDLFQAYFKRYNFEGVILDGYPRTKEQSKFLLQLLNENQKQIAFIMIVENDDATIIQRITGRRICSKDGAVYHVKYKPPKDGKYCMVCGAEVIQRSDDNEENIKTRLKEYQEKTIPAIEFLKSKGIPIISVPGNLPVFTEEKVKESVMGALKPLLED